MSYSTGPSASKVGSVQLNRAEMVETGTALKSGMPGGATGDATGAAAAGTGIGTGKLTGNGGVAGKAGKFRSGKVCACAKNGPKPTINMSNQNKYLVMTSATIHAQSHPAKRRVSASQRVEG